MTNNSNRVWVRMSDRKFKGPGLWATTDTYRYTYNYDDMRKWFKNSSGVMRYY